MSSAGAHCNHINHVETQLPYAISVAALSFVCYILTGLFDMMGVTWLSLPIGVVLTIAFLFFMKKRSANA
jgi:Na+/H+ antiporter NhaC